MISKMGLSKGELKKVGTRQVMILRFTDYHCSNSTQWLLIGITTTSRFFSLNSSIVILISFIRMQSFYISI